MVEMKKVPSCFILVCIFILLPGCHKSTRNTEHSWQNTYTKEFLNYKVQGNWLIEQISLLKFKKQIHSNKDDEHDKARLKWFVEKYKKNDIIWRFANPPEMWENLQGVSGYVLIHRGKQIATFITDTSNIERFLIVD